MEQHDFIELIIISLFVMFLVPTCFHEIDVFYIGGENFMGNAVGIRGFLFCVVLMVVTPFVIVST